MTSWHVEEEPARRTVHSASTTIDEIVEFAPSMASRFETAATACDHLEIGAALDDLLQQFADPLLQAVVGSGENITARTSEVIDAIVGADLTMAADAERAVYSVPTPPEAGPGAQEAG